MKKIKSVAVYCSASDSVDVEYKKLARDVGYQLAKAGLSIVYGGAKNGLMGIVADSAMASGGRVTGYITNHLKQFEQPNENITDIFYVETMHTRKQMMFDHADAFLILPGGFGTLDETFEIIVGRQLALHTKPLIFLSTKNYWKSLETLVANIFEQGFAKEKQKNIFCFTNSIEEALSYLTSPSYS